jgi:putative NADH-flavin reductase
MTALSAQSTKCGTLRLAALLLTAVLVPAAAQAAPLNILVYGGTGNIGQRIVNEALARGDHVTVVVRNPPAAAPPREGLRFSQGNVLDAADVEKQIAGQDLVIDAVSEGALPTGLPATPQAPHFYAHVAEVLVDAARHAGANAPRLMFVGGASSLIDTDGKVMVDKMPGGGPDSVFYMMKEELDYLRTVKDVSWTVLTPAGDIHAGKRTGKFRLGTDTIIKDASGNSSISEEDFAVAMIDEAHAPKHIRERFTLGY